MRTLHLFNPENDLALAANETHYTPRAHAAGLALAGELLPLWWAEEGDFILATRESEDALNKIKSAFGLNGEIYSRDWDMIERCQPWGWSKYVVDRFVKAGVAGEILPAVEQLDRYRTLSSRATAKEINVYIKRLLPDVNMPDEALVTDDIDEAMTMILAHGKETYVKSPWSSSGRGVFCTRSMSDGVIRDQIGGIVRRQSMVTVERALDKQLDFAALYNCTDGVASFMGWSVFATYGRSAYLGNYVAPQHILTHMITSCMSRPQELQSIMKAQKQAIERLVAPWYTGVLGVDMMVYVDAAGYKSVAPCVEMNLRQTMGMVAIAIQQKLNLSDVSIFSILFRHDIGRRDEIDILPPTRGFRFTLTPYQNDFST